MGTRLDGLRVRRHCRSCSNLLRLRRGLEPATLSENDCSELPALSLLTLDRSTPGSVPYIKIRRFGGLFVSERIPRGLSAIPLLSGNSPYSITPNRVASSELS